MKSKPDYSKPDYSGPDYWMNKDSKYQKFLNENQWGDADTLVNEARGRTALEKYNSRLRSESPFRDMRVNNKIFINDSPYTRKSSQRDSTNNIDRLYSSLSSQYKRASKRERQILSMFVNNLVKDNNFAGLNFYNQINPNNMTEGNVEHGYYDAPSRKANVYIGAGLTRNPIGIANHEMFHSTMDEQFQDQRNPNVPKKQLPHHTYETYFSDNPNDFGNPTKELELGKNIINTITDTQDIIDPTGNYKRSYPADNINLYNNAFMRRRVNEQQALMNSPEELTTFTLDRIGAGQGFTPSNTNKHANKLARQALINTKDALGRLNTSGFNNYPEIQDAFNTEIAKLKRGGYIKSSKDIDTKNTVRTKSHNTSKAKERYVHEGNVTGAPVVFNF